MLLRTRYALWVFATVLLSSATASAANFATLYSVTGSSDGAGGSGLLDVGGTLYGATRGGGTLGLGTVFALNPVTRVEKVLYSFTGGNDGISPNGTLIDVGGMLYATTANGGTFSEGTVFSVDPVTATEKVLQSFNDKNDGAFPEAALLEVGGTLYGTTQNGGTASWGTVFSIDPATGVGKIVYSFLGVKSTPSRLARKQVPTQQLGS
jgi:uncharacterized repeat protein (TIGR03803 family)